MNITDMCTMYVSNGFSRMFFVMCLPCLFQHLPYLIHIRLDLVLNLIWNLIYEC
jgi:hypothetical protein